MTASYGPAALACSATCRVPAMLDRSPTTTAVAAGRAARASSALAALRACSVTEWPSSVSTLAAISPRPSVEPVMSTRDISYSLQTEDNDEQVREPWLRHGRLSRPSLVSLASFLPGFQLASRAGAPGWRASVR